MPSFKPALAFLCLPLFCFLFLFASTSQAVAAPAVQEMSSELPFATVKEKALNFIKSKNLTIFAEYDHAKNAQDVSLQLPPTTVIVFGSPMVGTKLMQAFPGIGMELPLKILIRQNAQGKVVLSYPNLAQSFAPYGVPSDNPIVGKMQGLLQALAKAATQK